MKILVTGGAGYLGSVLVPKLLKANHKVMVVDNFMYNQTPLLDVCYDDKLEMVSADARDRAVISSAMKKADAIIPLACITGMPACSRDEIAARTTNFEAVKMIVDLKSKSQRIIFPTTNSGYGVGEKGKYCTEKTPLRPVSLYGRLKVEIEKIILDAGNSITLRLATAFGLSPRMRLDLLVNDFTYRAVTDRYIVLFEAHFKRNFIHVRDVAGAFMHALDNFDSMKNEPYNVGLSDANLSKWELCEKIKQEVPGFYFVESKIGKDPDKRDYIVSNEKIEKTRFKPEMSLQAGIKELIKGYKIIRRNTFSNV